jgi:ABC-type transport system involved in multi-copper enzyme maturation permease subunit
MAVTLIAGNVLRENRWPILLLFLWITMGPLIFGGFGGERVDAADVAFYIQQDAIYIVIFSAFLASHAIHHERRSRRILLVLSKAVSRSGYLMGMLLGIMLIATISALALGVCSSWLASESGLPRDGLWLIVPLLLVGSALVVSCVVFLSTFLHPLLAVTLSIPLLTAPALANPINPAWYAWAPGLRLLKNLLSFGFQPAWTLAWNALPAALIEAALFYTLAALIFLRTDIAAPIE